MSTTTTKLYTFRFDVSLLSSNPPINTSSTLLNAFASGATGGGFTEGQFTCATTQSFPTVASVVCTTQNSCNANGKCTANCTSNCGNQQNSGSGCMGWVPPGPGCSGTYGPFHDPCTSWGSNSGIQGTYQCFTPNAATTPSTTVSWTPGENGYYYDDPHTIPAQSISRVDGQNGIPSSTTGYVTFNVTYQLTYPCAQIPANAVTNLIATVNANSQQSTTQSFNATAAQGLIQDFCQYNATTVISGSASGSQGLCSMNGQCGGKTYFGNQTNSNPCCTFASAECVNGWNSYCQQNNSTLGSTQCQQFYTDSFQGTNSMNASVSQMLLSQCANLCTTTTEGNTSLIAKNVPSACNEVCPCFLPAAIYDQFKESVSEQVGRTGLSWGTPSCYYPTCNDKIQITPLKNVHCNDQTFVTCQNEVYYNLVANGNISDVNLTANQFANCYATSTGLQTSSSPKTTSSVVSPTTTPKTVSMPSSSTNRRIYLILILLLLLLLLGVLLVWGYISSRSKPSSSTQIEMKTI